MKAGWIWRGETRDLDDAARRSAAGSFVRLSAGFTHYETADPGGALPPAALVHGFSVPYFIWDPTFAALASAGMNPIRYDLYGRGFSDRPRVEYCIELFVSQLQELLDYLQVDSVDLLGLSMGGVIAAAFTARFPSRVRRLVLIDPSGSAPLPVPLPYRIAALPGIGEAVLGLLGTETLLRGIASDFFDPSHVALFQERYRVQMAYRGFKRSILSTIRCHMLDAFVEVYQRAAAVRRPVMLVWGEDDSTVPFDQSLILRQLFPDAVFRPIPAAGHIPHYERPEEVNPTLIEFLGR
jgi:pimeloyl-ACP methyl ester carboxylesterase